MLLILIFYDRVIVLVFGVYFKGKFDMGEIKLIYNLVKLLDKNI